MAIEKTEPGERADYVGGACASDPELRGRVEALLLAHEQSGDLLDPPVHSPGSRTHLDVGFAASPPRTWFMAVALGTRIGLYRIRQTIGEGGRNSPTLRVIGGN
jgi:eukaryotic-like serine/threonine-protein kinase